MYFSERGCGRSGGFHQGSRGIFHSIRLRPSIVGVEDEEYFAYFVMHGFQESLRFVSSFGQGFYFVLNAQFFHVGMSHLGNVSV